MKNYQKSKLYSIVKDIWSILFTIALLLYLGIGFFNKIWHPTWLMFVGAVALSLIIYVTSIVYYKKSNKKELTENFDLLFEASLLYAKCVKISGWLFVISVVSYILLASFSGLWHPLWLIFMVMAVIEQIIALIFKIKFRINNL